MKTATFTKGEFTIYVTALNSAGMGFLARLVGSGHYTEEEAFDLCEEYEGRYVSILRCPECGGFLRQESNGIGYSGLFCQNGDWADIETIEDVPMSAREAESLF